MPGFRKYVAPSLIAFFSTIFFIFANVFVFAAFYGFGLMLILTGIFIIDLLDRKIEINALTITLNIMMILFYPVLSGAVITLVYLGILNLL